MELRDRLRLARRRAGLSQQTLAALVRVHRSAVAQWEAEDGTLPSVRHLLLIAEVTAVRLEWLAIGRGPCSLEQGHSATPETLEEHARDEVERRILDLVRRVSPHRRRVIVDLLELAALK